MTSDCSNDSSIGCPRIPGEQHAEVSCSICFDPVDTRAWRELACGHCFHEGCLLRWVQSAPRPHCPLCRFDLEASALSEFETDIASFRMQLTAFRDKPPDGPFDPVVIFVGAEHCRRRLFDAVFAHFQKLLSQPPCADDDQHELAKLRQVLNDILHQLQAVRHLLERRPGNECSDVRQISNLEADAIGCLGEQFQKIHTLLRRLRDGLVAMPCDQLTAAFEPCSAREACTLLEGYLTEVRSTCALCVQSQEDKTVDHCSPQRS